VGDPARAITEHDAALDRARDTGNGLEQARAHDGLARAYHELGHLALAREHAGRALALYTSRGVYDPSGTRGFLAGLG
jgi:tetratricopeptide (TPR) repeat protein